MKSHHNPVIADSSLLAGLYLNMYRNDKSIPDYPACTFISNLGRGSVDILSFGVCSHYTLDVASQRLRFKSGVSVIKYQSSIFHQWSIFFSLKKESEEIKVAAETRQLQQNVPGNLVQSTL